jgi:hypothetical protein
LKKENKPITLLFEKILDSRYPEYGKELFFVFLVIGFLVVVVVFLPDFHHLIAETFNDVMELIGFPLPFSNEFIMIFKYIHAMVRLNVDLDQFNG